MFIRHNADDLPPFALWPFANPFPDGVRRVPPVFPCEIL